MVLFATDLNAKLLHQILRLILVQVKVAHRAAVRSHRRLQV